jgi:hypothetical protein
MGLSVGEKESADSLAKAAARLAKPADCYAW